MVRNTGASSAGGGGSARSGLGADDEVGQRGGRRARRAAEPPRRPRRARRATDASSDVDRVVADARRSEPPRVHEQRVARLPLPHLVGRPVALRVAFVVAVPAVGGGLDDDGTASGADRVDHRRPSRLRSPRRRCRRPRRSRRRSRRRAARAAPRAGSTRARTRRSRCSRRRRSPAAARPRRGSPLRGTRRGRPRRRRRTPPRRCRRLGAAPRSRRPTAIGRPAATIPLAPKIPMLRIGDVHRAPAAAVRALRPCPSARRTSRAGPGPWRGSGRGRGGSR